jgi:hypothetical protein
MASRIYKLTTPKGIRLIDAGTRAAAVGHVAKDEISVDVATGHEIADLVGKGVKVESIAANANKDLFVKGEQE